jgi:hypothetical protein
MNTENEGVLYVIGNGFDLNLELKTSYKYFFDNIIGLNKKREEFRNLDNLSDIERKDYFVRLKSNSEEFLLNMGLFFIFLLLVETEKDEWQSIEVQISKYIEDIVNILEDNLNERNYQEVIDYLYEGFGLKKINKLLKFYVSTIQLEQFANLESDTNLAKLQDEVFKIISMQLKKCESIYNLIEFKTKLHVTETGIINEKEWENYCKNIVNTIDYINFTLENLVSPDKEYKKINENGNFKFEVGEKGKRKIEFLKREGKPTNITEINPLDSINKLEKEFLKSAEKENNTKKHKFSETDKIKIDRIMKEKKFFIINFNYTTYLKEYFEKDSRFEGMININGSIESENSEEKFGIFGIDEIEGQKIINKYSDEKKRKNLKRVLEKFYKPNRRREQENEWKEKIKKYNKIYFYGHSLADSDFSFFKELFENKKINNINLFENDKNYSKVELIFLYERDFFNDGNIKSIVKLFYNYYHFVYPKEPKTKDEILNLIFNLRKKGILKIKIRENNRDEYEDQNNGLILDDKGKLEKLLLEIKNNL